MIRAIFLDRDGVVNHIVDRGDDNIESGKKVRYTGPRRYEELSFKDGVHEVIQELRDLGFLVILTTNQPDMKYGNISKEEYDRIMNDVQKLPFHDIFVCLHGREDGCVCKKPKSGMMLAAAEKHNIDLSLSYMVGDTENDTKAGKGAGCTTILVEQHYNTDVEADIKVNDLREIVDLIKKTL